MILVLHYKNVILTLPLLSLLAPTPIPGGVGGWPDPSPAISKTVVPMNLKFCGILETSINVLEMLKLFTWCLLVYGSNSSKQRCLSGKSVDFSRKYPYSNYYQNDNLIDNIMKLF